jgi:hypothetical protein
MFFDYILFSSKEGKFRVSFTFTWQMQKVMPWMRELWALQRIWLRLPSEALGSIFITTKKGRGGEEEVISS